MTLFLVKKTNLSVVIIALNEESNIERCLKSVQWAHEIIVYDSGSTDKTVAIAQGMGAKVTVGPWLGFGPTKNKAAELAANDWIFSLDADEEVPATLHDEIDTLTLSNDVAYSIPRLSYYLKQWIHHGGWYPDYQVRLFNRTTAKWTPEEVHEKVEAKSYAKLSNHLNHYVFKSVEHHISTNNRYSGLLAQKLHRQGIKFSILNFIIKPNLKFFECYILKLGFMDGWAGYFIAKSAAYSVFLKWSKLKELEMHEL